MIVRNKHSACVKCIGSYKLSSHTMGNNKDKCHWCGEIIKTSVVTKLNRTNDASLGKGEVKG